MRKLLAFLTLFLVISTYGYSQTWNGIKNSSPSKIQESLISSSEEEILVDVKVGGYFSEIVNTPKGDQLVISGEGMASMLIKGAPELPMYPISMIIGDKAEMQVSVIKSQYTDIEGVEIAPSKGNLSRQIDPNDVPFEYGEMYQQDAFYPAQQASLEKPYILRDFRGQNIMVYPYAYNPVTKTLRVYTHLVISAKKVSDNGENQKVTRRGNMITLSPETKASYERRFINFPTDSKYDFLVDRGEMLVVCIDEYMDALQPLVDWKNISGRPTTMEPVSKTGTLQDLKAFIADYYAQHPNLTYVLLVGEHDNLPGLTGYSPSGGRSDNAYAMIEGSDFYEELFVGRLCVNSEQDAINQVNKVIYYERSMDSSNTWMSRAVGIGANEGAGMGHHGEADFEHMDFIRDTLMHYTYTEVSQHYSGINSPTAANMRADFNTGATVANYCNHGNPTGWAVADFSNSDVHQLTNDYRLPYIWSVACNNGEFSYDECFGEAWMRATNSSTGAPTGAVGGMFSWISQPWLPPMYGQDEMVAILTEWRSGYNHTLGGVSLNGNMYVLDMSPGDSGDTHNTWILFGDPSMMVRTTAPQEMEVSLSPQVVLVGSTELEILADTDFGIATLSRDGEVMASAYIEDGSAKLTFEEITSLEPLKLVVLGYNKVTYEADIVPQSPEGAYVIYNDYNLNDDNGQLDSGEHVNLSLDVKNVGVESVSNVNVVISTDSEYVILQNNSTTVASIAAGEIYSIDDAFTFDLLPSVPNGKKVKFYVSCSSGSDTWASEFTIVANAPIVTFVDVIPESDNGILPGEEVGLYFTYRNTGDSNLNNVMADVISSSSDIQITNIEILNQESIPAGGEFKVLVYVQIASSAEIGSMYQISAIVGSGYYYSNDIYDLVIGNIIEDFETGDFTNYEWQHEGNLTWVINNTNPYEGTYCARSGAISNSSSTSLKLELEVLSDGEISFMRKVSCEATYDFLAFYIDGQEKGKWSGEMDWALVSYFITEGTHSLEWKFAKDVSVASGMDCAFIDYIKFPAVSVITLLDPVTDLVADVQNSTINLSWNGNADEYIIRRNGEVIATQAATSLTDNVATTGTYTYSVVSKVGNNFSEPAFIVVNVGYVNVIEVEENNITVYPNPTAAKLNVAVQGDFDAVVYNYQGQVVRRYISANNQIDISELAAGIYFVEIRTNNAVVVEKVIKK